MSDPLGSQESGTETEARQIRSLLRFGPWRAFLFGGFMNIVQRVKDMQRMADLWRKEGKVIALVPTMGYFHEGHLALMRLARHKGDMLVISIFVNPIQFGPQEDYQRYPRDIQRDMKLAESVGVDVIFAPDVDEMYPSGFQTYVDVPELSRPLCGKSREGHFRGVATVVAKLFNIVKPHVAIFGAKDYQQLLVIRRMVEDLNMDIEIVGHPTVRESDGLAMSSRNVYLSPEERKAALRMNQSFTIAQELIRKGVKHSQDIISNIIKYLTSDNMIRIDYVDIRDAQNLEEVEIINRPVVLALAAFIGQARLIDNIILSPPNCIS